MKSPGETCVDLINRYKKLNNVRKCCFVGRLDPMAMGKLLILEEDECKKMPLFLNTNKTYQFEILLGFETDTDDVLGVIKRISAFTPNVQYLVDKILWYIQNVNCYEQKYHHYSSINVDTLEGKKPLWYCSKNNIQYFKHPRHKVLVHKYQFLGSTIHKTKFFKYRIFKMFDCIKQDFRQDKVKESYNLLNKEEIISLKFELSVSSGYYIRQLIRELNEYLKFPITTFMINRVDIK